MCVTRKKEETTNDKSLEEQTKELIYIFGKSSYLIYYIYIYILTTWYII